MPSPVPQPLLEDEFIRHSACVLLPTYNNAQTLAAVLEDVLKYTTRILVVNDGATDATPQILAAFPQVKTVSYATNKGKGYALRTGFKAALAAGYSHAITIDSDGQHYASDLGVFLSALDAQPGALMIGARNMGVANIPGKSSFGNKFSNFWFWVNTGIRLPDTQSGYRLYPLQQLARKKYFTRKYEFEIEVIVRAAWSGIPVIAVPVSVYYPPAAERISHFRPGKDFTRISILNTVLVLIAVLYIKPRDFLRLLFSRAGWKKIVATLFVQPQESNLRKASSVGFGIFMGIVPVWGFQLAIGIPVAILLRLNKTLFLLAANISIFPFTVFWLLASLATGKWLLGERAWMLPHHLSFAEAKEAGAAFFLGGSVLALALGLTAFAICWLSLTAFRKRTV